MTNRSPPRCIAQIAARVLTDAERVGLALMASDRWSIAYVLLFVAIMLDSVNGVVARKLDQVSKQGISRPNLRGLVLSGLVFSGSSACAIRLHPSFEQLRGAVRDQPGLTAPTWPA